VLIAWVLLSAKGTRRVALRLAVIVVLGVCAVMGPWWMRNASVYGKSVPTALWLGASLYDGLNPNATGASEMSFLGEPGIWPLDEERQDAELRARAWEFARKQPGRTIQLALIKAARFWCPWPNVETFFSPGLAVACAAVVFPLYLVIALGAWNRRRDGRALVLLGLPLLYTFALHVVFVSSMRYRIPAGAPALGLAAAGLRLFADRRTQETNAQ
jgi:hypothetical protein